jgi:hypothetical protein
MLSSHAKNQTHTGYYRIKTNELVTKILDLFKRGRCFAAFREKYRPLLM